MGLFSATVAYFAFSGLHLVCLALALTVCGLYGADLNHVRDDKYPNSKWIYAVVVGALSAITCVVYFIPLTLRRASVVAAAWSFVLLVLWIAVFGTFAALFMNGDPGGNNRLTRMKNAVWVDLTNALLWLVSSLAVFGYWWKHRDRRSQFTGRAHL